MAQKKDTKKTPQKNNAKSAPKKTVTKKQDEKENITKKSSHSQAVSVIMFGVALLLAAVCFIPGGNAWGFFRNNIIFGIFGCTAFLWCIMLIFSAVMVSKELIRENKVKLQLAGIAFFILSVSSLIHIFSNTTEYIINTNMLDQLKQVFSMGLSIKNGGLFGALIGGGLTILCDSKAASVAVLIILMIVIIMLFTKTTLAMVGGVIKKPIEHAEKRRSERKSADDEYEEAEYDNDFTPVFEEDAPKSSTGGNFRSRKIDSDEIKPIEIESKREDTLRPEPIIGGIVRTEEKDQDKFVIKPFNIDGDRPPFAEESKEKAPKKETPKRESTKKAPAKKASGENFEVGETSYIEGINGKSVLYKFPPINCLAMPDSNSRDNFQAELESRGNKLVETLRSFGVETKITEICRGPSVTRFEIQPAPGVKISKITGLADDIAMNMASSGVRIEAPIPNKAAVGIEIPNKTRSMVRLREIIDSDVYMNAKSKLNVALGKDITGNIICADLAKMPHLLIAGTTGSGKSVCLNSMIVSLLYNATPDEVKLLMIDPKQVEFTVYNGIPHLLVGVVSDPRKSAGALSWAVTEMLNRYKLFSERNVRDIKGYNKFCEAHPELPKMPQIVIFIDELSDLMMAAPNEVEDSICRLAQMARAAGMHLVIATQRPSVDVITGIIKANIPSRISLSVSSQIDSRTIIDTAGAEKLLGNGDMLFAPVGMSKPLRVQGAFLSDSEVESVVEYVKSKSSDEEVVYDEDIQERIDNYTLIEKKKAGFDRDDEESETYDDMLPKAIEVVVEKQQASTTLLQKKLGLGYARASRIMDSLEERGIVGPFQGSKPREVLLSKQRFLELAALSDDGAIDMRSPVSEGSYDDDQEDIDEDEEF